MDSVIGEERMSCKKTERDARGLETHFSVGGVCVRACQTCVDIYSLSRHRDSFNRGLAEIPPGPSSHLSMDEVLSTPDED